MMDSKAIFWIIVVVGIIIAFSIVSATGFGHWAADLLNNELGIDALNPSRYALIPHSLNFVLALVLAVGASVLIAGKLDSGA